MAAKRKGSKGAAHSAETEGEESEEGNETEGSDEFKKEDKKEESEKSEEEGDQTEESEESEEEEAGGEAYKAAHYCSSDDITELRSNPDQKDERKIMKVRKRVARSFLEMFRATDFFGTIRIIEKKKEDHISNLNYQFYRMLSTMARTY